MDIFLVLLLAIAIYQLYGWKWAVPATLFVILLSHESDAPTIVWLFVVLLVALLRVVTERRLKKFLQFTGAIVVAIALLQVLSFTVYEIRTALYPQLEKKDYTSYYEEESFGYSNVQAPMTKSSRNIYKGKKMEMMDMVQQEQKMNKMMQNRIDPNAVVQTGIGKPSWSWKRYTFSWQSGVGSEDRLELWLISPLVLKILKVLNIVGMFFLLYLFLHEFGKSLLPSIKKGLGAKSTAMALLFVSPLVMIPQKSYADIPPPELLKELKERLTEPPACLPNCAQMDEVNVSIEEDRLTVHLNISAGSDISVPLLGNRNIWLPEEVLLNGIEAKGLSLGKNGGLWLMLTQGVHQVVLKGTLKGQHQVMLNSRLPLHNLQINTTNPLWKITSDKKSYIEINSLKQEEQEDKAKSTLKPLIEVTRTLYFGQYWYIDTEVKLLNTIEKPYTLRYPLFPEVEAQNNQALVHLSSKRPHYAWCSSLPITASLALKAMQNDQVVEVWQMDISTIWDMNFQGIEPIEQLMDIDIIMPRFKPWQGEELTLNLERTKAVKGENLTIESSQLKITQSGRYRDVILNLSLKSSQAGQYTMALKDVKELKPTLIDGRTHYLKVSNGVVSIPLHAKAQKIKLSWREEIGTAQNYQFPNINLQKASTNSEIRLTLPKNRWILWTDGPTLGPAVLLWV